MKKPIICLIFILLFSTLFAQVSVDPTAEFYENLQKWEAQGIVKNIPNLRPYPVFLIKTILEDVMMSDNLTAVSEASQLYEDIFRKSWNISVDAVGDLNFSRDNHYMVYGLAGVEGDVSSLNNTSLGYQLKFSGVVNKDQLAISRYTTLPYSFKDAASMGKLDIHLETNGSVSVGTPSVYFQAGINHNSFGYFYGKNTVFSSDAEHSANFSVVLNKERFSYVHSLFILGASNGITPTSVTGTSGASPNKFLALHGINGKIFDWLYMSFFETMIYGNRFEPAYLVPVVPFMVTQGVVGYSDDNLIMGLGFSVRPVTGLVWNTSLFLDDVNVNELFKLDFDTKIRGALQTEISYTTTDIPVLSKITGGCTLITPYMYSHGQLYRDPVSGKETLASRDNIHFQSYTNSGKSLGSQLDPNSAEVSLSVDLDFVENLSVNVFGNFICHGNVNESLTKEEAKMYLNALEGYFTTDGTLNNHQMVIENDDGSYGYLPSSQNRLMFLSQDTLMYVAQAGVDIGYTFPRTVAGEFSIGMKYIFEFVKNDGVRNNMFIGKGKVGDDGKINPWNATDQDVEQAISNWKNQLKDVINNYLTFSVQYRY